MRKLREGGVSDFFFPLSIVKDLLFELRSSMFMKTQFMSPLYNVDMSQLLAIKRNNRRKMEGRRSGRFFLVVG